MTITDETLSAFLDGELSGEERAQVEAAIAADPALEARLSALDAATRRFAAAIRETDAAPMPAGVEDLLRPKADNVVAFKPRKKERPKWAAAAAIAASLLALVVAAGLFGAGPGGGERVMIAAGPIDKASPLHRALDRTASADSAQVGRSSIRPVATFRVAGGALCREFIAAQGAGAVRAVACREDRQWTVKIAAEESPSAGGYQTASGPAAAIGAYVDSAIKGDPLGPDDERALIDAKWRGEN
jgi:anti-sigma factor RsiW